MRILKKLAALLLSLFTLTGCGARSYGYIENDVFKEDKVYRVSYIGHQNDVFNSENTMNGIWVSQFDMHPIFRDGGKQRDKEDFREKIEVMMSNLKRDGFDTVFLQIRPNGDSMYESEIYPLSKYIAGVYGGRIEYDAIDIYLSSAKRHGISVHAWINPFRLCHESELNDHATGKLYEWANEGYGKRIERGSDGILYLDPSYQEATDLIVSGVNEILKKYSFDGIHIDDYFYPTEFEFDDESEFNASGYADKGDFRRANINRTVKAIYEAVHKFDNRVFGISPAGNIYSLENGWYADIYRWCEEDGFVDYVMPQLYFGFENATCPFETVLKDWCDAVKNEKTKLFIGLSAAKCALGSEGQADTYAGEKGKFEWRDNKDILARSLKVINESEKVKGYCIFTYSSFYDPLTGENNPLTVEEKTAFCEVTAKKENL